MAALFHELVEAAALLVVEHGADFGVDARAQALQVVAAFFEHGLRQLAIFVAVALEDFANTPALIAAQVELVGQGLHAPRVAQRRSIAAQRFCQALARDCVAGGAARAGAEHEDASHDGINFELR